MTAVETDPVEAYHGTAEQWEDRLLELAEDIARGVSERKYEPGEPVAIHDTELRVQLMVEAGGDQFLVELELANAIEYEGEDGAFQTNFSLMVTTRDGRILAHWCPYNYTDQCWVDLRDEDALEARWSVFTAPALRFEVADTIHEEVAG